MDCDRLLACPDCRRPALAAAPKGYACGSCGATYIVREGIPVFLRPRTAIVGADADRAAFWDAGWENRNNRLLALDREGVLKERQDYLEYVLKERYPSAVDIGPDVVAGKTFLNIGCGGGFEGLLFAGYGAHYIGVDFSQNAVRLTRDLIRNAGFDGAAFQAEAEALPFRDGSIEYVYSSGVLHHTPNIEQALKEACRVLAPGGTAMIALYATRSLMFFWYRLHAVLCGNLTLKAIEAWMHANTEGAWQTAGRKNKWTKTYTEPQFRTLLTAAGFSEARIQQSYLQVKTMPIVGKIVRAVAPGKLEDLRVGRFGSMLVATCRKR
ncbi:MAG: methyltransferase domain-containing protein [Rhodospirillales bacterium]|nr:methyltransferase domain-containing protein [Rhodospirillales bacterium]